VYDATGFYNVSGCCCFHFQLYPQIQKVGIQQFSARFVRRIYPHFQKRGDFLIYANYVNVCTHIDRRNRHIGPTVLYILRLIHVDVDVDVDVVYGRRRMPLCPPPQYNTSK